MPGSKAGDEDGHALETPQKDDSTPSVLHKLQVCSLCRMDCSFSCAAALSLLK
jgi:hypothetical protein